MSDTLGLLAEVTQLARDLGYEIREEPLGELLGGRCEVGGVPQVLLNLEQPVAERLDLLLRAIADDPRLDGEPKSRLLEQRLRTLRSS
ncbi:MAG TPA: hypothetical protein DC048_00905 [Planctomycetaceae bacterium]|nr:hypothetical protein [Planctomycetaceae bacterium]